MHTVLYKVLNLALYLFLDQMPILSLSLSLFLSLSLWMLLCSSVCSLYSHCNVMYLTDKYQLDLGPNFLCDYK